MKLERFEIYQIPISKVFQEHGDQLAKQKRTPDMEHSTLTFVLLSMEAFLNCCTCSRGRPNLCTIVMTSGALLST